MYCIIKYHAKPDKKYVSLKQKICHNLTTASDENNNINIIENIQ